MKGIDRKTACDHASAMLLVEHGKDVSAQRFAAPPSAVAR